MKRTFTVFAAAAACGLLATPIARAADESAPTLVAAAAIDSGYYTPCPGAGLGLAQRRALEKAEQGGDALRQWLFSTRAIFGLDPQETFEFVNLWRAGSCAQAARA
jgi:hypothetical protein